MPGTSGNLSVVLAADPLRLAVTVSGADKGELTHSDIVMVDENGAAVDDHPGRRPSAEGGLHARIAMTAAAGAVVHLHLLAAVVAAQRWPDGVPLAGLEMLKGLGRTTHDDRMVVPVIDNSQDMQVLGKAFDAVFQADTPAVIVAGHGLCAWGADLHETRQRVECLDWLLRFAVAADPGDQAPSRTEHHRAREDPP